MAKLFHFCQRVFRTLVISTSKYFWKEKLKFLNKYIAESIIALFLFKLKNQNQTKQQKNPTNTSKYNHCMTVDFIYHKTDFKD